jgi:tetratricopeptide (TPR) repeat protein
VLGEDVKTAQERLRGGVRRLDQRPAPPRESERELEVVAAETSRRPGHRRGQPEKAERRPTTRPTTGRRPSPTVEEADEVLSSEVVAELVAAVGPAHAPSLRRRLSAATRAYARDRYEEARRSTRQLVREAPESAAVRELHGLVCYRMGSWREAVTHLEAARARSRDPSQLPVLMDCQRAMGHHRRVDALWEELRAASAPADVHVEGRLVLAEDLAERGEPEGAIALLTAAGAARNLRHPAERHVRQWYVLADLYERVGDVPMARTLFARVVAADPELADASDRLRMLGPPRRPPPRRERRSPR